MIVVAGKSKICRPAGRLEAQERVDVAVLSLRQSGGRTPSLSKDLGIYLLYPSTN